MSDVEATEGSVEAPDDLADLPPFPEEDEGEFEETPEAEAPEEEVESAEEASEDEEGIEPDSPESDDDVPDLSQFPEDTREIVRKYGDKRVSALQREWQAKLEAAAEAKKKADAFDSLNEWAEKDPAGFVEAFSKNVPATPKEPPPPPDIIEDPAGYSKWMQEQLDARVEQRVAAIKQEFEQKLAPAQQMAQQAAAQAQMAAIKQKVGADDEEWSLIQDLAKRANESPWELLKEHAALKRQLAGQQKKVEKAVQGIEEKPGLPKRGARKRPAVRDPENAKLLRELEEAGIEFPD